MNYSYYTLLSVKRELRELNQMYFTYYDNEVRLSSNDKSDNEMIPGAEHRSLGMYPTSSERSLENFS